MGINLKTAMFAAMTLLAALPAAAETTSPMVAHDPLMNQIMSKQLTLPGGGVTGSVRIGSGQAITLSLVDPLAPLKPVEGLVAKPVKAKARRKVRRADEQLKKMSEEKHAADWAGRK
ncbi:MAG: hypothetical protein PHS14_11580 [Elusimicrobia bacterium]|nr:hypothetical protein [Elusimicrobiota bacterium]